MKTLILLLCLSYSAFAGETIHVQVNGMVCAFCAQGIKKNFEKKSSVRETRVNLDKKEVEVVLKEGQKISDEEVKSVIANAGFDLVKIERKIESELTNKSKVKK